jgi:tetratricopeptide (TPR) repeat protein
MIRPMRFLIVLLFAAPVSFLLAEERPAVIGDWLEGARKSLEARDFVRAHAALDRFEKANKPTAESLDVRGCVYMEQGNFAEAAKAFEAAHDTDSTLFPPRIHTGDLLLRQKKFAEAREVYEMLAKETNITTSTERLRFGILITYLAEHDEARAHTSLESINFPTQTPAYYYAQAAWALAHGNKSAARNWIRTAQKILPAETESWFARPLYELGWLKKKPPVVLYQSI